MVKDYKDKLFKIIFELESILKDLKENREGFLQVYFTGDVWDPFFGHKIDEHQYIRKHVRDYKIYYLNILSRIDPKDKDLQKQIRIMKNR